MTKCLILGALLAGAAGCAPMPATATPSGASSGVLLTINRGNGFMGSGHKLVLFQDGRLQFVRLGQNEPTPEWDEVPIAPPAMAKVRSSLDRLSALPPDCCNCVDWTDQSSVVMTFQVAAGTGVKRIDHDEGCHKTPKWVYDVENEIDDALGTERWVEKRVGANPGYRRGSAEIRLPASTMTSPNDL
jgi:hypothetical protein